LWKTKQSQTFTITGKNFTKILRIFDTYCSSAIQKRTLESNAKAYSHSLQVREVLGIQTKPPVLLLNIKRVRLLTPVNDTSLDRRYHPEQTLNAITSRDLKENIISKLQKIRLA
jgi:hypothetical protein